MEPQQLILQHMNDAKAFMLKMKSTYNVRVSNGEMEDLIQEAYLILSVAAKHYNPNRSEKFTTYLGQCIKHGFWDWCNRSSIVYFPAEIRRNRKGKLTKNPELMEKMRRGKNYQTSSSFVGIVEPSQESAAVTTEALQLVEKLNQQERQLIECYYGLNGRTRKTLSTLAAEMDVHRNTAHKRVKLIVGKLGEKMGEAART